MHSLTLHPLLTLQDCRVVRKHSDFRGAATITGIIGAAESQQTRYRVQ